MHDILLFAKSHWTLSLALIIVIILLMMLEFMRSKNNARRINHSRATLMINHDNAIVLDVRTTEAFLSGHIVDAISLPANEIQTKLTKLDKYKTQPIIVYCANGTDSDRIANLLIKQQFNAFVLQGGLRQWKEANLPLVKG